MGPIVLDLLGTELSQEECELLKHPSLGGVIFFARNYQSPEQMTALSQAIRAIRKDLLLMVDQEGGRVQRFKQGFLPLPSMAEIADVYAASPAEGEALALCCGWLMAAEVLAVGVDLSLAPVLDLDRKMNLVVGDRSFSRNPQTVITLASAFIQGMRMAGMAAVGKHFPGHGAVTVDSHIASPRDDRSFTTIFQEDMQPFIHFIQAGIAALMPAHIIFSAIDSKPAGFSAYWLKTILRDKLNFQGVIFSDDLNMAGASFAGNYAERAKVALTAGCDMVLICNNRQAAIEIIQNVPQHAPGFDKKIQSLRGKFSNTLSSLHASAEWKKKLNYFVQYRKSYENNAPN